ncbi:MAG: ribosome maturation factor RimM [Alphaproteobacteria bacterium]|nr:ribosome maturation factor RimM [Alphaproteobacteria bacterium]
MVSGPKICAGMITGAHGVRGLVRLRSFMENPEAIFDYTLTDDEGEKLGLKPKSADKDCFVVAIDGVGNREAAQALRGTKLYVTRSVLPKTKKREYYEADLIGLVARDAAERDYGPVRGVHNHGGGTFLEIGTSGKSSFMLPFTDTCVPDVDIKGGCIKVTIPPGWLDKGKPDA